MAVWRTGANAYAIIHRTSRNSTATGGITNTASWGTAFTNQEWRKTAALLNDKASVIFVENTGPATQDADGSLAVAFANSATATVERAASGSLAFAFSNTSTAVAVRETTGSLALTFSNTSSATRVAVGDSTGTWSLSNTSSAERAAVGSASLAVALSNTAAATVDRAATASLAVVFSNSATASATLLASGSLAVATSGTSTGLVIDDGGGALTIALANSASADVINQIDGSLAVGFSNTASATIGGLSATGSLAVAFSNSASALLDRNATATSTVTFANTASGVRQPNGSGSLAVAFSNSGTGVVERTTTSSLAIAASNTASASAARGASGSLPVAMSNTASASVTTVGSTILFEEDYQGTAGASMSSSNTEFELFPGAGTKTFETFPTPLYGTTLGQYNGGSPSTSKDTNTLPGATNGGTARTDFVVRGYYSVDSLTSLSLTRIIVFEQSVANGGADVAVVRLNANGTLRLLDGTTPVGSASVHALSSSPTRLEWTIDQVANTQTLHMWWGSSLQSTAQTGSEYESITGSLNDNGVIEVIGTGLYASQATNHSIYVQAFAVGYGGLIGPKVVEQNGTGSLAVAMSNTASAQVVKSATASLPVAFSNTGLVGNPPVAGSASLGVALSNSASARVRWEELLEGSNGSNVTTSNSTFTGVGSGGSLQFSSAAYVPSGTTKARLSVTSQTRIITKSVTRTSSDITCYRVYYTTADPAAAGGADVIRLYDTVTGAPKVRVEMNSSGNLVLRDGNTSRYTTTKAFAANEWFRLEVMVDEPSDRIYLRVWWGANLHSESTGVAEYEASGARVWTQADFDQIRLGSIFVTTNTFEFDALGWQTSTSTSDWFGPPINANAPPEPSVISGSLPVALTNTATAGVQRNLAPTLAVGLANTASASVVRNATASLAVSLTNSATMIRTVDVAGSLAVASSGAATGQRSVFVDADLDVIVDMGATAANAAYTRIVGQLWPRGGG